MRLTAPQGTGVTVESFRSPYATEEDWLLTTIVTDLSDMAAFASSGNPTRRCQVSIGLDAQKTRVARVTFEGKVSITQDLPLAHSTWSPEDYEVLAGRLVSSLQMRPTPTPDDEEGLLYLLLGFTSDVIEEENVRTSSGLKARPADPRLHEEAALILGTLALRETTGAFSDSRQILCRMTAHLGLARGLRGSVGPGVAGRWAEVLLALLAGRGADAEEGLRRLEADGPLSSAREAWAHVFRPARWAGSRRGRRPSPP